MKSKILQSHLIKYFLEKKFVLENEIDKSNIDLFFSSQELDWALLLGADQSSEMDYLKTFELAMQALIEYERELSQSTTINLCISLAFSSTLNGEKLSYRRALKKYSNSIVFNDLAIHLLLVEDDASINHLSPTEVSPFLREMDTYIIKRKN